VFFFEKKNQKTFDCAVADPPEAYAIGKSFLLLFFKKEGLSSFLGLPPLSRALTRRGAVITFAPRAKPDVRD
jgi:hypothetical protein